MNKRTDIAYIIIATILLIISSVVFVRATPNTPDVLITELQTANTTASEEFIELYNTTDHDIDFADSAHLGKDAWKIQFFSSTKTAVAGFNWDPKTSGLTTISLTNISGTPVVVAAHSYFLISTVSGASPYTPGGVDPDFTYSNAHMSDIGGGIQLVDVYGSGTSQVITAHDRLGWFKPTSTVALPNGMYLTPAAGSSLQRTVAADGSYIDAYNNLQSFVTSDSINPKEAWSVPVEPPTIPPTTNSSDTPPVTADGVSTQPNPEPAYNPVPLLSQQPIRITELLPNPAAPQTDQDDEFIELFNPNDQTISISGYTLQTGLKLSYSYTIPNLTIPAMSYITLMSAHTNLSLANSGGQAQLLDKNSQIVSQTNVYGEAPIGQSWSLIGDSWQWTITPTPGSENVITNSSSSTTAVRVQTAKPLPVKSPTKSVITTKNSTTKKTIDAKTPKSTKSTKKTTSTSKNFVTENDQPTPLHTAVLVGVGAIAILYAAYEYRTDMGNKIYQFRRDREARRAAREASEGS